MARAARLAESGQGRAVERADGRRTTKDSAATRTVILDATERIMREEGYAAVSSRRVAARAGLKSQLVYYHFGTMDELFLAVLRRAEHKYFARHARALPAREPLRALWNLSLDTVGSELELEFMALAKHRPAIRREIVEASERFRTLETSMVARALEDLGVGEDDMPPEVLAFAMLSVARGLATEAAIGLSMSHEKVRAYVVARLAELAC
jgi:AcrR family transcriptional regulator